MYRLGRYLWQFVAMITHAIIMIAMYMITTVRVMTMKMNLQPVQIPDNFSHGWTPVSIKSIKKVMGQVAGDGAE